MVALSDLNVITHDDRNDWHSEEILSFDGRTFIVGGHDYSNPTEDMMDSIMKHSPMEMLALALGAIPEVDSYVMEAKWDTEFQEWVPLNECGPHCETGVCNKRVATDQQVGSLAHAKNLLVDYLNA